MIRLGQAVTDSIRDRILRVQDVNDGLAPPLKRTPGRIKDYPWYKVNKYHAKPVRDWWRTGQTLRSMQVISASIGKARIGFFDNIAPGALFRVSNRTGKPVSTPNQRAYLNNRIWRMFGISPTQRRLIKMIVPTMFRGKMVKSA